MRVSTLPHAKAWDSPFSGISASLTARPSAADGARRLVSREHGHAKHARVRLACAPAFRDCGSAVFPAPRHPTGPAASPTAQSRVGQSERPAFTRLRTRSVGRRGTDPRPRFDAARGLLAANATALLVANGGAASVSPAGALASAGVDLRTPDGRRPLARRGRYGALPIPAARLRP